ncbi:MAG: hypothetical protein WDO19_28105 [Bacteroidota bacterium]
MINQFLIESTILSILSMILALILVFLLLPFFNQVSGKHLQLAVFFTPQNISLMLLLTIITGLAAGLYPAFVLSSFKPIQVLKGKFKSGSYGFSVKKWVSCFPICLFPLFLLSAPLSSIPK